MRKFNPWGLLVLAAGVLLLLNALGVETGGVWSVFWKVTWPVLVILCGLSMCYSARRVTIWGFLVVLLGGWWLLARLGVLPGIHWGVVGGIVVIIIGAQMLFERRESVHVNVEVEPEGAQESGSAKDESTRRQNCNYESADGFIRSTAVFWGDEKNAGGEEFRGASLKAVFGGVDVALLGFERFAPDAQIDVSCAFGGVKLIVPKNVRVISSVNGFCGGVEIKGVQSAQTTTVLHLCGSCAFGGVEVQLV